MIIFILIHILNITLLRVYEQFSSRFCERADGLKYTKYTISENVKREASNISYAKQTSHLKR